MCWIMVKQPGNNIPFDFIDEAQKRNRDGYGVSWVEDGAVQTFKTLDYEEYKTKLTELEDKLIVVHLRATSAGTTCIDNVHPFTVPTGVMFHNGTITGLKSTGTIDSDTNILAQLISKTKFKKVTDIAPLLYAITGTTYNKLVFLNKDNTVSYINKNLGIDDPNGNWYSNNYHVKEEIYNVFVYGTLKHGFSNHFYYMTDSDYVDDAFTLEKHAMIGEGNPFPYVLGVNEAGHHIKGEVYEVPASSLSRLDRLEGYPTHYDRVPTEVVLSNGEKITALMYVKKTVTAANLNEKFIEEFKKPVYTATVYKNKSYYSYDDY